MKDYIDTQSLQCINPIDASNSRSDVVGSSLRSIEEKLEFGIEPAQCQGLLRRRALVR